MKRLVRNEVVVILVGVAVLFAVFMLAGKILEVGPTHTTYYVSPSGSDTNSGKSEDASLGTIQQALEEAQPGDKIQLADGEYAQSFHTVRAGKPSLPIVITGSNQAVVRGEPNSGHVIDITHDLITLDGFTVDGASGDAAAKGDFRDKLIYAIGDKSQDGVNGLVITRMVIQNAGGECVRLRYFAQGNEISHSTIRNCGIYDFRFNDGGKNGEGIYIGTAPEQRGDGKNPDSLADESMRNYIHHNTIETYGNECVDIKEAATHNLVEYNVCRFQQDPQSGGLDARGDYNIFRYNTITNNKGAGVRLGGDSQSDGTNNSVYSNDIKDNDGPAINIVRSPQARICGNNVVNNGKQKADTKATTDAGKPCE